RIQRTAKRLALLDVLCSLAAIALEQRYCRPSVTDDAEIHIVAGRHPVVESMTANSNFIPNDVTLKQDGERLLLITGPNMGGKSTYLRQAALIVLMTQIGSFVPAEKAEIGLVDRIFTRVGASDNLVRGQSTFMVEMQEAANILQHATARSLVILDEVGRGTSTYDGVSIAWAILEYLHDAIKSKTLFATHYHELIPLAERLPHAANYSVAVKENAEEGVVFLYKILRGGVDKSYGIEVAKLAGMPASTVARAQQILKDLEEGILDSAIQKEVTANRGSNSEDQLPLFSEREHQSLQEIKTMDLNGLTPLQALQKLDELKKKLNGTYAEH
ncbi:MAG TPA: DNA mismatch repair protein MutS, partial [Candidatus Gracilibacteria bacterium]|nr:DNA mismatch repair protein MutS [Candidatus Gracilibacteria bacterium]